MADSNDFPISFFKTPEPDQLSLADIVGAVGEAAGYFHIYFGFAALVCVGASVSAG